MAVNTRTVADENKSFEDWIELRNVSASPVNLDGWALSGNPAKPRQWLFPSTNLPAGGHLVVWASGKNHRLAGAPLHTSFRLSRDGEYLALVKPDGTAATEFKPKYPPQWPDASFGFLPGVTQAVFFTAPTPGRANESSTNPPGPFIASVTYSPAELKSTDAIKIIAEIRPLKHEITNVTLIWRTMFRRETNLIMIPQGDGLWSATLPSATAARGQMLRWRVTAQDTQGALSAYPLNNDPRRTSKYIGSVVEPSSVASTLPVFQLFIAPQSLGGADSESGASCCVFYDGEFYDNVFIKVRGNTTAGFPKKSHRLEFPKDHAFRHPGPGGRVRHTSFMAEWGDPTYLRQHLSFWLLSQTGSAAPFHYPVRLQLNGEFWQLAMHSEVLGEELIDRHGLDPDGALYKAVGTLTPDGNSTGGFEKKTRRREGIRDYLDLAQALSEDQSLDARRRALFERMNLPAVINYIAVARLTQEDDDIWANLSLYHDNDGTGEWRPIPFDMNVSWGLSFAASGIVATRDSFRSHPFFGAANVGANQGHNRLYDAMVRVPETREMLLRRTRTILDRWWQPPGTPWKDRILEQHIAQLTNAMAAEAALDRAKWGLPWTLRSQPRPEGALAAGVRDLVEEFIEPRRRHYYVTHSISNAGVLRPLGITSRCLAGIPLPQTADVGLEFDEVKVHPAQPAIDYVTLTNANSFAVDLSGWTLNGAAKFVFPQGTVLPAHYVLHVAANVKAFRLNAAKVDGLRGAFVVGSYHGKITEATSLQLRNDHDTSIAQKTVP
jgi:hypothetical protein